MRVKTIRRVSVCVGIMFMLFYGFMHYYVGSKSNIWGELKNSKDNYHSKSLQTNLMDQIQNQRPNQPILVKNDSVKSSYYFESGFLEPPKLPVCDNLISSRKTNLQMSTLYDDIKFENKPGGVWTQGFPIEYDLNQWKNKSLLEVFIVPHSHHDPGWIFTIDEYYEQRTKYCLDSTLNTLLTHDEARFIYAEVLYFSRWYENLSGENKLQIKKLLDKGHFEIVSGGWVMPDEGTTHYYAIIDQMIEGHQWLLKNLDYRPSVSWSIDPFGQSMTMPYLIKKTGFSAMIINRVHYEIKKYLARIKALEFNWYQIWDQNEQTKMFTHMFPFYSYDIPHTCGPQPNICCQFDFLRINKFGCPWKIQPTVISTANIQEKANLLADQYRKKATLYNNGGLVLIPLGDDFRYLTTNEWMIQLDNYNKLIDYINSHPEYHMKVRFATLSDYVNAVLKQKSTNSKPVSSSPNQQSDYSQLNTDRFPSFSGDLFTCADRNYDYWSGYYTSRPYEKQISRLLESELRTAEILYSFVRQHVGHNSNLVELIPFITKLYSTHLTIARRSLGTLQHHDAITGTSRPHVVKDYDERLLNAIELCKQVISLSIAYLSLLFQTQQNQFKIDLKMKTFLQLYDEIITNKNNFKIYSLNEQIIINSLPKPVTITLNSNENPSAIYIFNPHPYEKSIILNVHLNEHLNNILITNDNSFIPNKIISTQIEHINEIHSTIKVTQTSVYFGPINLKPLSVRKVLIQPNSPNTSLQLVKPVQIILNKNEISISQQFGPKSIIMENSYLQLFLDPFTGYLETVCDKLSKQCFQMKISFIQYDTPEGESHSGAYLFIPNGSGKPIDPPQSVQLKRGSLVDETTVYNSYMSHTIRLYKAENLQSQSIEIENHINLKNSNTINIDLAMRIKTNLTNLNRVFYTDSNCFQFVKRQYYDKLPLQGNVYPLSCGSYLDENNSNQFINRLNIFTSRPLGITSSDIGSFTIFLDRRTTKDDRRGLEVPLQGDWNVKSLLRLYLEQIPQNQIPDEVPRLTITAQHMLNEFLQPIHQFHVNNLEVEKLFSTKINLIPTTGFPCDYELVSMKTFENISLQSNSNAAIGTNVGIILRRLNSFCFSNSKSSELALTSSSSSSSVNRNNLKCLENLNHNINVKQIFDKLGLSYAVHTNLTFTTLWNSNSVKQNVIEINPMELDAFFLI